MTENVLQKTDLSLQTNKITPELINYLVKKIITHFSPYQIILFGSYAQNLATSNSDLDLFIVQSSHRSNREVRREIDLLFAGRGFALDLIVRKPEEVELNLADNNPFYIYHLFKQGKVLYERTNPRFAV